MRGYHPSDPIPSWLPEDWKDQQTALDTIQFVKSPEDPDRWPMTMGYQRVLRGFFVQEFGGLPAFHHKRAYELIPWLNASLLRWSTRPHQIVCPIDTLRAFRNQCEQRQAMFLRVEEP